MDYLKVLFGILLGWAYTEVAHYMVPMEYRITGLIVAYFLILLLIFALIKPAKPFTLSLWLTCAAIVIIMIEDIVFKQVPVSRLTRGLTIILCTTIFAPFVVGWIYNLLASKKK
jgi:uncharacterized membrane protein